MGHTHVEGIDQLFDQLGMINDNLRDTYHMEDPDNWRETIDHAPQVFISAELELVFPEGTLPSVYDAVSSHLLCIIEEPEHAEDVREWAKNEREWIDAKRKRDQGLPTWTDLSRNSITDRVLKSISAFIDLAKIREDYDNEGTAEEIELSTIAYTTTKNAGLDLEDLMEHDDDYHHYCLKGDGLERCAEAIHRIIRHLWNNLPAEQSKAEELRRLATEVALANESPLTPEKRGAYLDWQRRDAGLPPLTFRELARIIVEQETGNLWGLYQKCPACTVYPSDATANLCAHCAE
jgi:hypothetical protein